MLPFRPNGLCTPSLRAGSEESSIDPEWACAHVPTLARWHESDGSLSSRCLGNQEVDQCLNLRRPGQCAFNIVQQVGVQLFTLFRDTRPH